MNDFKLGDSVYVEKAEIFNVNCVGKRGVVIHNPNPSNGCVRVKFEDGESVDLKPEWLKLASHEDILNSENMREQAYNAASYIADEHEVNPMEIQVGGDHYKKCKIQPVEYIHANGLDFFQGNIVKYITRFRDKGGKADLEKIKHYCNMLIELEYPEKEAVDFECVL